MNTTLTAVIEREDDLYVALCPEFDVVSQGATVREAREPAGGAGVVLRAGVPGRAGPAEGSHVVMRKSSGGETVTVPAPDHRDLAVGALRAISSSVRPSGGTSKCSRRSECDRSPAGATESTFRDRLVLLGAPGAGLARTPGPLCLSRSCPGSRSGSRRGQRLSPLDFVHLVHD